VERIEELSQTRLDSKLVKIYTGLREGEVLGYAVIEVHNVRTLPEAFMVVMTPEGSVRSLRLLAFHEPLDYLPTERWYEQFAHKSLESPLHLGGDVHGVVGATLSAQATTRGVRRALALYEVLVRNGP
jgi:Na+-translocating ferredoxin:NAD+ oxidoreductase RnfG subunit